VKLFSGDFADTEVGTLQRYLSEKILPRWVNHQKNRKKQPKTNVINVFWLTKHPFVILPLCQPKNIDNTALWESNMAMEHVLFIDEQNPEKNLHSAGDFPASHVRLPNG